MIDHECYDQERPVHQAYGAPPHTWNPGHPGHPVGAGHYAKRSELDGKFSDYHMIPKASELTEHQLLLLPNKVHGWILKDRKWGLLCLFPDIL